MFAKILNFEINNCLYLIILSILSYILGSFNFPIIVSKHFGKKKDIRSLGSNNAGFSNVLRSVGILPAFLVFVGDFLKGVLSVYIGNRFINNENISLETNYSVLLMFGFFCFLGHIYPCFFKFKGGKGILTAWAINLLIDWKIFLVLISIFLIFFAIFRIVSVASVLVAAFYPSVVFIFSNIATSNKILWGPTVISFIISTITIFKHKSNLYRLSIGKENRVK